MTYPSPETLAEAGLELAVDGAVLTVTLNRPDVRNAQTPAMWRGLAAVGAAVEPDVRVVVLRGAGASFSAGLDRAMLSPSGIEGEASFPQLAAATAEEFDATIATYQEGFTWLRDPRFISIAAVQGHAVGAGFQLALACDLRVLADDAQLCMKEPALGLVPDLTGTKPLVDAVGYARALEICATARWVSAQEAHALGIGQEIVPVEGLDARVAELAAALTAAPHHAVSATKGLLQSAGDHDLAAQTAAERRAQRERFIELVTAR
ncbi:enoyl-CoA hydratase/isomerase family protein [Mumia sp. zg.B21]|uniref:enoyl-CoA hydratase/isomerase family protein n=1 Tax=Mumia sp. zg.B21 TaxID=2855447 RepID=UPI001C6E39D9|nr:enoyl-CoA hydratase/isomerase family protein [Mumia sp. zg.B21]MBW9208839.1 enoyl-CoA hydratase/isomerase family protein [Mumia sp. zg.B21]